MKLQLTKQADLELKLINKRIDDAGDEGYDDVCESLNKHELLITDAGMYVHEAYINNEFINLEEWSRELGLSESDIDSDEMFKKINMMIELGIIEVVE
jgi:hypothetical protein